jgi:hypothetical protein
MKYSVQKFWDFMQLHNLEFRTEPISDSTYLTVIHHSGIAVLYDAPDGKLSDLQLIMRGKRRPMDMLPYLVDKLIKEHIRGVYINYNIDLVHLPTASISLPQLDF